MLADSSSPTPNSQLPTPYSQTPNPQPQPPLLHPAGRHPRLSHRQRAAGALTLRRLLQELGQLDPVEKRVVGLLALTQMVADILALLQRDDEGDVRASRFPSGLPLINELHTSHKFLHLVVA